MSLINKEMFDEAFEEVEQRIEQSDTAREDLIAKLSATMEEIVKSQSLQMDRILKVVNTIKPAAPEVKIIKEALDISPVIKSLETIVSTLKADADKSKEERLQLLKIMGNLRSNDYASNIDGITKALQDIKESTGGEWEFNMEHNAVGKLSKIFAKKITKQ